MSQFAPRFCFRHSSIQRSTQPMFSESVSASEMSVIRCLTSTITKISKNSSISEDSSRQLQIKSYKWYNTALSSSQPDAPLEKIKLADTKFHKNYFGRFRTVTCSETWRKERLQVRKFPLWSVKNRPASFIVANEEEAALIIIGRQHATIYITNETAVSRRPPIRWFRGAKNRKLTHH